MAPFDNCLNSGLLQIELELIARVCRCAKSKPKAKEQRQLNLMTANKVHRGREAGGKLCLRVHRFSLECAASAVDPRQTPATHRLVVRHLDRPGVLAGVLDAIKGEHINVQEMENIVFDGAEAAVARINLDNAPSRAMLNKLQKENVDIIELDLLQLSEK